MNTEAVPDDSGLGLMKVMRELCELLAMDACEQQSVRNVSHVYGSGSCFATFGK